MILCVNNYKYNYGANFWSYIWQICCSENGGENLLIKLYNYLVIIPTMPTLYLKVHEGK